LRAVSANKQYFKQGRIQGRAIGSIVPPKTYESKFIHHNFVQFGKQHLRLKTILSSIFLSQQFCEAYYIFLAYNSKGVMRLDYQISLKSPPLKLLTGSILDFKTINDQINTAVKKQES